MKFGISTWRRRAVLPDSRRELKERKEGRKAMHKDRVRGERETARDTKPEIKFVSFEAAREENGTKGEEMRTHLSNCEPQKDYEHSNATTARSNLQF